MTTKIGTHFAHKITFEIPNLFIQIICCQITWHGTGKSTRLLQAKHLDVHRATDTRLTEKLAWTVSAAL